MASLSALSKESQQLFGLISELMDDKVATIVENIDSRIAYQLAPIAADVKALKEDMQTVKAAVTATNRDVQDHERHITRLEKMPV